MLNTSQKLDNKNSVTWWYVFKTSWRRFCKTSWRRLEDVLKRYGQDEYNSLDQDIFKTSSEDVWSLRIYSSSPRRLEDVVRRRRPKTSTRRLHQDECFLGSLIRVTRLVPVCLVKKLLILCKAFYMAVGSSNKSLKKLTPKLIIDAQIWY